METTERASARKAACEALLQEVRSVEASARTGFPGQRLLDSLLAFADHHRALFPESDFASPRAHSRMHGLSDGLDTPYGLYLGVSRPGKEAAPHCHGVWSVSALLTGRELQRYWRVVEQTSNTRAQIEETNAVTLAPGTGMAMGPQSIHSTTTLEGGEARMIQLFACPLGQGPRLVFYHPAWGTRRVLPQATGRTLGGRGSE